MNRPTELRTYHDMRQQLELERMLAARRAAEAAREAQFRKLSTPQHPEPANFCHAESDSPKPVSRWIFWPVVVAASMVMTFAVAEFAARVLPIVWGTP